MNTKLKCTLVPVGMNSAKHWLTIRSSGLTVANLVNQPTDNWKIKPVWRATAFKPNGIWKYGFNDADEMLLA